MIPRIARLTLFGLLVSGSALHAQDTTESAEHPPLFSTGVAAGAIRFPGGRTDQVGSLVLQLQPFSWLSFSAAPGYGRTSLGPASSTGMTEIPLTAGAMYSVNRIPWSPALSAEIASAVSGDSALAAGMGERTVELQASLSASPTDGLNVSAGWSHSLRRNNGNPSLRAESALSLGRATATVGFSSEIGRPDSGAVLSRSLAAGFAVSLVGPVTLTTDASHGISGSAPTWTFSVGLGSAFAGVSPLNPTSALRRLKQTFGSKVSSGSGYKGNGNSGSCRRNGTC